MNYVKSCLIITMLVGNCILANNCAYGDLNEDGDQNVLDVVLLAQCVLSNSGGTKLSYPQNTKLEGSLLIRNMMNVLV